MASAGWFYIFLDNTQFAPPHLDLRMLKGEFADWRPLDGHDVCCLNQHRSDWLFNMFDAHCASITVAPKLHELRRSIFGPAQLMKSREQREPHAFTLQMYSKESGRVVNHDWPRFCNFCYLLNYFDAVDALAESQGHAFVGLDLAPSLLLLERFAGHHCEAGCPLALETSSVFFGCLILDSASALVMGCSEAERLNNAHCWKKIVNARCVLLLGARNLQFSIPGMGRLVLFFFMLQGSWEMCFQPTNPYRAVQSAGHTA